MSSGISITPRGGAFTGRGGWSPSTVYFQDDFVVWQGTEYQSLLPVNKGNQPDTSGWAWIVTPGGGTTPTVVAARAHRTAALTTTALTWTKVSVDTLDWDSGSNMNTTLGRFVAPSAGYYQVEGQVAISPSANDSALVGIFVNGVQATDGSRQSWGAAIPSAQIYNVIADVFKLNAGDYVELYIYTGVADALQIGPNTNYLTVSLIQAGAGPAGPQGPAGPPTGPAGGDLSGTYPNPSVTKVNGTAVPLTASTWSLLALTNGWANPGAPWETAAFLRDPLGFVHLKGVISGGATGTVAFTLPAGYRPGAATVYPSVNTNVVAAQLNITVNGQCTIYWNTNSTNIGLSGLTFLAEN